ncbi:hypothetical protein DMUE_4092, partial [Dictyocoela muelleri]
REQLNKVLSIYHRYISGHVPTLEHDNMNSYVQSQSHFKNSNIQKKTFKMNLADTEITVDVDIEVIENIHYQNIEIWINQIKELIKNNNYSKVGGIAIIKAMLSDEIKKKRQKKKTQINF